MRLGGGWRGEGGILAGSARYFRVAVIPEEAAKVCIRRN